MTNEALQLLAAAFQRLKRMDPEVMALHWRKAAARSFADIGAALEAGLPPAEVAKVCFAAAEAFHDPDSAEDARARCERALQP